MAFENPIVGAANARPNHPAIETQDGTLTYLQLRHAVQKRATQLAGAGIRPGDTVALKGVASLDWVVTLHAIGWLDAVAAPLDPYAPEQDTQARLAALSPRLVWTPHSELPHSESHPPAQGWAPASTRLIVFTSGSTGTPKPIHLSTCQVLASALGTHQRLAHAPNERWLSCLPLHHIGGLQILMRSVWAATTVVLRPGFVPEDVAQQIDKGAISAVSLVPVMLREVLDQRPSHPFPSSLHFILLGGAPADADLIDRCRTLNAPVALTWGMTETAAAVTIRPPGHLQGKGVGQPTALSRVEVEPDGRLVVLGPVAPGGRFASSDQGQLTPTGEVQVFGRMDDVIISGGENIAPARVAARLMAHPAISEAAVVGQPNPRWGERPIAWLVLQSGTTRPDNKALRDWCRQTLAPFEVPDAFDWCSALPRTALGKVSLATVRSWGSPSQ